MEYKDCSGIPRADKGGRRKVSDEVKKAIEGLCLKYSKPPVMWVYRQIAESCQMKQLPIPGYWIVLDIYRKLDKRLKTLAHEGDKAYEQEFDPLLMREAKCQNDTWQCDHKDLKIWAIDHNGRVGKVQLTAIFRRLQQNNTRLPFSDWCAELNENNLGT